MIKKIWVTDDLDEQNQCDFAKLLEKFDCHVFARPVGEGLEPKRGSIVEGMKGLYPTKKKLSSVETKF